MNRYTVIVCASLLLCASAAHAGALSNVGGAASDLENEKVIKRLKKDLKHAIKAELKRRKNGWGEDRIVRKARGLAAFNRRASLPLHS